MMDELKTLKDLEISDEAKQMIIEQGAINPVSIVSVRDLKKEVNKWVKRINEIVYFEYTEDDKIMVPCPTGLGKVSKGYLRENNLRQKFVDETGVWIDDEYDRVDGLNFIKKFFNLEDE